MSKRLAAQTQKPELSQSDYRGNVIHRGEFESVFIKLVKGLTLHYDIAPHEDTEAFQRSHQSVDKLQDYLKSYCESFCMHREEAQRELAILADDSAYNDARRGNDAPSRLDNLQNYIKKCQQIPTCQHAVEAGRELDGLQDTIFKKNDEEVYKWSRGNTSKLGSYLRDFCKTSCLHKKATQEITTLEAKNDPVATSDPPPPRLMYDSIDDDAYQKSHGDMNLLRRYLEYCWEPFKPSTSSTSWDRQGCLHEQEARSELAGLLRSRFITPGAIR
jgi:hypothetical protein